MGISWDIQWCIYIYVYEYNQQDDLWCMVIHPIAMGMQRLSMALVWPWDVTLGYTDMLCPTLSPQNATFMENMVIKPINLVFLGTGYTTFRTQMDAGV